MPSSPLRVLTGASRGLGRAIALDLARDGGHLLLTARDRAGLETTAAAVRAAGAEATVVVADLSTEAGRAAIVAAAEAAGPVDALVNNAGIEITVSVLDHTPDDIEREVAVNLVAPLLLTRAMLPGMVARGRGAVVMVSSMSGKSATPYNAVYAATKHGLVGFTSSLRIELDGTGVHAGVVCPSFVRGEGMWADTGLAAPAGLREVEPARVCAAVRAVLGGSAEVLVTPTPVRPLLALAQLFPALDARVLRWMGVLDVLEARARVALERRGVTGR